MFSTVVKKTNRFNINVSHFSMVFQDQFSVIIKSWKRGSSAHSHNFFPLLQAMIIPSAAKGEVWFMVTRIYKKSVKNRS